MDVLRKANELQQKLDDAYDVATATATAVSTNNPTAKATAGLIPERVQVLHLEVGQPETGAPKQVSDAAIKALTTTSSSSVPVSKNRNRKNVMGYTDAFGLIELRKRIRQHYIDKYYLVSSSIPSISANDNNNNNDAQHQIERGEVQPQPHHTVQEQVQVPDISQIVITTGSSGAFLLAFTACFDPGDVVAIASSGYPCYRNILQALGCSIATCPINTEYKLTATELQKEISQRRKKNNKKNQRIKGLILSSPSNPTGSMLTPSELQELCILCNKENILFISDEIYHGISYGNVPEATALQFATATSRSRRRASSSSSTTKKMMSDNNSINDNNNNNNTSAAVAAVTFDGDNDSDVSDDSNDNNLENNNNTNTNIFIINSFSKYYSMPGWRLGWMIVPQQYVQSINKLQQNMFINAPTISQTAALECFGNPQTTRELQNHITKYRTNREIIINVFESNLCKGLSMTHNVAPPDGGFYIYIDLGNDNICIYNNDIDYGSVTMCEKLLDQYYVAFTPGIDFEDPTSTTIPIDDDGNGNGNSNGSNTTINNNNNNLGNRRFRISYAGSTDAIQKAMEKFIHFWNHVWLIELATAKVQVKIEKFIFKNAAA